MKSLILTICFSILAAVAVGLFCENVSLKQREDCTPADYLPSQIELQEMLIKLGANIEADGVIGAKTRVEWDRIKFGEYAAVHAKAAGQ